MTALGNWMTVNGEALKATRASGIDASSQWGDMTMHKDGNRYYAIVFDRPSNGIIDITSVTTGKIVNSITATRLTSSGSVAAPITNNNGIYTVNLDAVDLDAQQSATFRIDIDAIVLPTLSNIALGKSTTASSVYDPTGLNLHDGLAVDGDKSANTGGGLNIFHSDSTDADPWFQVDLGDSYRIREIILYNRSGFESRLRDITIEILDASDTVVTTFADLNDGNVLNGPATLNVFLQNAQVVSGRKIRVTRDSDPGGGDDNTILALSEIEVKGSVLADATLDGAVDQADIDLFAANWGTGTTWEQGDMNEDGNVDQADLTLALAGWTDSVKANLASVPAAFLDADTDKLDDNWEMIHFGNTAAQDHSSNSDGDAYDNLWELAFGGDPTVNEKQVGGTTLANQGASIIELQFKRPKNHASTGIVYQIRTSTDLSGWGNVTSPVAKPPIGIDASREWGVFELPYSGNRTFFSIEISSATP